MKLARELWRHLIANSWHFRLRIANCLRSPSPRRWECFPSHKWDPRTLTGVGKHGWSELSHSLVTVNVLLLSSSDNLELMWPDVARCGPQLVLQGPLNIGYGLPPILSSCSVQWSIGLWANVWHLRYTQYIE